MKGEGSKAAVASPWTCLSHLCLRYSPEEARQFQFFHGQPSTYSIALQDWKLCTAYACLKQEKTSEDPGITTPFSHVNPLQPHPGAYQHEHGVEAGLAEIPEQLGASRAGVSVLGLVLEKALGTFSLRNMAGGGMARCQVCPTWAPDDHSSRGPRMWSTNHVRRGSFWEQQPDFNDILHDANNKIFWSITNTRQHTSLALGNVSCCLLLPEFSLRQALSVRNTRAGSSSSAKV